MKKLTLLALSLVLTACTKPPVQQSSVPLDMKTVQEYQQRITSGNTVTPENPASNEQLNQSDQRRRETPKVIHHYPRIRPSVGVGYHRGWGYRTGFDYY